MNINIAKVLLSGIAIVSAFMLASCGVIDSGNKKKNVDEALRTVSQQYGLDLKLKKKKLSGGALCNVVVTSDKTGSQEISVFRFDEKSPVHTDFMYVRYGADAYTAIQVASRKAEPGCKVIVEDQVYNHYPCAEYDKDSGLEGYLAENDFTIKVVVARKFTQEEIISEYKHLALSLKNSGINYKCRYLFAVNTQAELDAIKPFDHIPHKSEQLTGYGIVNCKTAIYALYRSLYEYCDDPDNISDVLIKIDGEVVKKL